MPPTAAKARFIKPSGKSVSIYAIRQRYHVAHELHISID